METESEVRLLSQVLYFLDHLKLTNGDGIKRFAGGLFCFLMVVVPDTVARVIVANNLLVGKIRDVFDW